MKLALSALLFPLLQVRSLTSQPSAHKHSHHVLLMAQDLEFSPMRRNVLVDAVIVSSTTATLVFSSDRANAVERAVGAAEVECRKAGNCLEKGDLDAAIGWNWGGKDRCDASDPICGPNGVLLDAVPTGESVPSIVSRVTHQIDLEVTIGKAEIGSLKLGLYGDATPQSVKQLLDFLTPSGLLTTSSLLLEEGFGSVSQGVSLLKGGIATSIIPFQRVEFGLPSQAASFARSRGMSKAPNNFLPQPRPRSDLTIEQSVRPHDCAGLVSIPSAGLGYASTGKEDEAFANGEVISCHFYYYLVSALSNTLACRGKRSLSNNSL